jgi:hypothetical protein
VSPVVNGFDRICDRECTETAGEEDPLVKG